MPGNAALEEELEQQYQDRQKMRHTAGAVARTTGLDHQLALALLVVVDARKGNDDDLMMKCEIEDNLRLHKKDVHVERLAALYDAKYV